jgi:hypothetical protein
MLNSPFQHSATHEKSYVQSVKQQPRTMVVSGESGRFVSKLIYSKKCNYSVRSRAGASIETVAYLQQTKIFNATIQKGLTEPLF